MSIARKIQRFRSTYRGILLHGIKHYNWWVSTDTEGWFARFLTAWLGAKAAQQFSLVSVFGKRRTF